MDPKVSIVTCSYNRPDLLWLAVESLRAQMDPDWEHLIYDEGSPDPRVQDVLTRAAEDPRVRVWRGEENRDRPSAVWNFLLDRARGRYFSVLDDDNEKLPDFVRVMSGELDRDPSLGLVTCGFLVRQAGESDWEHHHNLRTTPEAVERESTCEGGALLYRREAFEQVGYFSEAIRTNEDWDWVRRAVSVLRVKNLAECYAVYRHHDTNRQLRAEALGYSGDVNLLRSRPVYPTLGVETDNAWLQCELDRIPWVVDGEDVVLAQIPYSYDAIPMKDRRPLLLISNGEVNTDNGYLRAIAEERKIWICASDVSLYRDVVGDRVITCALIDSDADDVRRTRLAKVLNCVRCDRRNAVIP